MSAGPTLFDRYPYVAGSKARDTSYQAAEEIEATEAPLLRDLVYAEIKSTGEIGLTADEVAARLNKSVLSIRPRVTELGKQNRIVDTGSRRKNASDKSAIVWRCL